MALQSAESIHYSTIFQQERLQTETTFTRHERDLEYTWDIDPGRLDVKGPPPATEEEVQLRKGLILFVRKSSERIVTFQKQGGVLDPEVFPIREQAEAIDARRAQFNQALTLANTFPLDGRLSVNVMPLSGAAQQLYDLRESGIAVPHLIPAYVGGSMTGMSGNTVAERPLPEGTFSQGRVRMVDRMTDTWDTALWLLQEHQRKTGSNPDLDIPAMREHNRSLHKNHVPFTSVQYRELYYHIPRMMHAADVTVWSLDNKNDPLEKATSAYTREVMQKNPGDGWAWEQRLAVAHMMPVPENQWIVGGCGSGELGGPDMGTKGEYVLGKMPPELQPMMERAGLGKVTLRLMARLGDMHFLKDPEKDAPAFEQAVADGLAAQYYAGQLFLQ